MQDHGFVYFMLFTLWAVRGLANEVIHFRSYVGSDYYSYSRQGEFPHPVALHLHLHLHRRPHN